MAIFFGCILTLGIVSVVVLSLLPQGPEGSNDPFFGRKNLLKQLGVVASSASSAHLELVVQVFAVAGDARRGDRIFFIQPEKQGLVVQKSNQIMYEVVAINDASQNHELNATFDSANEGSDVQFVLRPCDITVEEIDSDEVAPKGCIVMRDRDNGFSNLVRAVRTGAVSFVNPRLLVFKYRLPLAVFIAILTYITIAFFVFFLQLQSCKVSFMLCTYDFSLVMSDSNPCSNPYFS